LVIWEYVSNSLQYVDPGVIPEVHVTLDSKRKRITVADNGRGMTSEDLHHFFVMHEQNRDRAEGRPGRGRFGTGKSAAFGIANILCVDTVRNRRHSVVELRREDLDGAADGSPIPVRELKRNETTDKPNGTAIEISEVHLRSLDQSGIIHYIERHLAKWPKGVRVFVNHHECEFAEPPLDWVRTFEPDGEIAPQLGATTLSVKVAKVPLEAELRGISIYSNGVWLETTLAGSENREMSQYIYGEVDVPRLDDDESPIPAYDVNRSMRLNPNNDTVRALYAFISRSIERVRRELVEREQARKASEEARKLQEEARHIAEVINQDFIEFSQKVARARVTSPGSIESGLTSDQPDKEADGILFGSELPAEIVHETGAPGHGDGGSGGGIIPREASPIVERSETTQDPVGRDASGTRIQRNKGGFRVEFRNLGRESYRALYESKERAIYVNLDHPQIQPLCGDPVSEDLRRRLSYEIAFSEYSVALASELASRDEYVDPTDPIVDIRETMNRLARRAAVLFAPNGDED